MKLSSNPRTEKKKGGVHLSHCPHQHLSDNF
jgi:hypothetical protein